MSVRNQLTHYELEEFFRSLQDLLVLSLNPSLSFDFAEFLSRRLDDFERTLNVLSSRLRVSYSWFEVQLLSDLYTLLFIVSQQRQLCEDFSYFALHEEEEEESAAHRNPVPLRSTSNKSSEISSLGRPGTPDLTTPTLAVESCSSSTRGLEDKTLRVLLKPSRRRERNSAESNDKLGLSESTNKSCKERKNSSNS